MHANYNHTDIALYNWIIHNCWSHQQQAKFTFAPVTAASVILPAAFYHRWSNSVWWALSSAGNSLKPQAMGMEMKRRGQWKTERTQQKGGNKTRSNKDTRQRWKVKIKVMMEMRKDWKEVKDQLTLPGRLICVKLGWTVVAHRKM